MDTSMCRY